MSRIIPQSVDDLKISLYPIKRTATQRGNLHIVIDSTGLKVFGEGEWKVRQHGYSKRRAWKKLHLAIDESNSRIEAVVLTPHHCKDSQVFEELIDQIMLRGFLDDHAVGIYAAATKVSSSCAFISYIIATSLLPAVVASKMRSEEEYRFRMQRLYDFMLISFAALSIVIVLLSDFIVTTLYGDAFAFSAQILAIHITCSLFISAVSVQDGWVVTENLQRYAFLFQIICALSNIIFNTILINGYGTIGAAYGTLSAYGFSLIFTGIFIPPMRPSLMMILKSYGHILTLQFLRRDYYDGPAN